MDANKTRTFAFESGAGRSTDAGGKPAWPDMLVLAISAGDRDVAADLAQQIVRWLADGALKDHAFVWQNLGEIVEVDEATGQPRAISDAPWPRKGKDK